MTSYRRRLAATAVLPAVLLAVGACSSTSGSSNGSTPSTSATASSSSSPSTSSTTQPASCAQAGTTYKTTDLKATDVTVSGEGAALTATFPFPACASALSSKDLVVGKGTEAKTGSTIKANYYLASGLTGQRIQSSFGGQAFEAQIGVGQLIKGWDTGIPGMKVGGRRVLVVPGDLAYGPQGRSGIAPNETLVFVIEMLAVT